MSHLLFPVLMPEILTLIYYYAISLREEKTEWLGQLTSSIDCIYFHNTPPARKHYQPVLK